MKSILGNKVLKISTGLGIAGLSLALASCGKQAADPASASLAGGAPSTSVAVQSHALAGPGAAFNYMPGFNLAELLSLLVAPNNAHAAVSSFTSLTACNDTLAFLDLNGNPITINGTSAPPVGRGLLNFSSTSTNPMAIGTINIPTGTVISEVDITFAVKPSICGGANYAVEFNDGIHGVIDITQNTAFKFKFPAGGVQVLGASQTFDLKLGAIVNAMVAQGAALSNASIQTINVGQAQ